MIKQKTKDERVLSIIGRHTVETKQMTKDPIHKEHVTPFMYRRGSEYPIHVFGNYCPNTIITMKHPNFSFDTDEDYELIGKITSEYDKHGDLNKALLDI